MSDGIRTPINKFGTGTQVFHQPSWMWPQPIHYREEPDSVMVKLNNPRNPNDIQAFAARCFNFTERFILTLSSPGVVTVAIRYHASSESSE